MKKCKDNIIWKQHFGALLKQLFLIYEFEYTDFCNVYGWSTSTVRYWFTHRNLPQQSALRNLKSYLSEKISNESTHNSYVSEEIKEIFSKYGYDNVFYMLQRNYIHIGEFVAEALSQIYNFAKNDFSILKLVKDVILPTGTTQAVVFDFDGTLTSGKSNRTTWERLWTSLGYNVRECQKLHLKYDRDEITHSEWCKLTENKFIEKNLHKRELLKIATDISLIDGIKDTFDELDSRNIKIYIVSGSIVTIIRKVLGDLYSYVEECKANIFKFDSKGYLTEIIGTKYDFQGKADFINQIAADLRISTKDILFVGNSINDRFAYTSGARTLCINPKLTDTTNRDVWNDCIQTCDNLNEILAFL